MGVGQVKEGVMGNFVPVPIWWDLSYNFTVEKTVSPIIRSATKWSLQMMGKFSPVGQAGRDLIDSPPTADGQVFEFRAVGPFGDVDQALN